MTDIYDFVVVGSGAGGGPVACNLAKAGYSVLLLEAGGDDEPIEYRVPAFHGQATQNEPLRWDFFVRHYDDEARQNADTKYVKTQKGVLYPRAGTLGGCTAHNAMITVYPHNSDWDELASLTGDDSWKSGPMRKYFQRLERCTYLVPPGQYPKNFWRKLGLFILRGFGMASRANPSRHGFEGWLTTSFADPKLALKDEELIALITAAAAQAGTFHLFGMGGLLRKVSLVIQALIRGHDAIDRLAGLFDPNDWRNDIASAEGVVLVPLATREGARNGTRERIKEVAGEPGSKLAIELHALATKVVFEGDAAVGVEYWSGPHLYRADPKASASGAKEPEHRVARARREVILAGGAFNTPQLLMLSGVGPADHLREMEIPVVRDLPGVGRNLQDRYEVGVPMEFKEDFAVLEGASFVAPAPGQKGDPAFEQWRTTHDGLYASNGAVLGIVKRSKLERPCPDLFIFGLPGYFKGYYPHYADHFEDKRCVFTWAILKAHTRNNAGFVRLASKDPRDRPSIHFRYFDEGNDASGEDLESVLEGVKFVRDLSKRLTFLEKGEMLPGGSCASDEDVKAWIKREAWGHHACGTCKIGADGDAMAVLDSKFRVRGVKRLRVVDASVFPKIPGFFIVTPIYMISEKASDVIIEDARTTTA